VWRRKGLVLNALVVVSYFVVDFDLVCLILADAEYDIVDRGSRVKSPVLD